MLEKKDVLRLFDEGLEIKFRRKPHPDGLRGEYDPAAFQVNIYSPAIPSRQEQDLTLLHEFIHARDDRNGVVNHHACRSGVEQEACETRERHPEVIRLIRELFRVGRKGRGYFQDTWPE